MIDRSKVINFETMGGWPIEKMNLRDIVESIGGKLNKETGMWEIPDDDSLDIFPTVLTDDGMGYGVDEQYIVQFSVQKKDKVCSVFRERKLDFVDTWFEMGRFPGQVVHIDDKDWMIFNIIKNDDQLFVEAQEYIYKEGGDGECGKLEMGVKRLFTPDEVKNSYFTKIL